MRDEGEIDRLREDCAQAYQAVGFLADRLGYWDMAENDPRQAQITKLLDNLLAASEGNARPHDDLLPFGWPEPRPAPQDRLDAGDPNSR